MAKVDCEGVNSTIKDSHTRARTSQQHPCCITDGGKTNTMLQLNEGGKDPCWLMGSAAAARILRKVRSPVDWLQKPTTLDTTGIGARESNMRSVGFREN